VSIFCWVVVLSVDYECAICCRTKCQAKLSLFLFLAGIVPTFIFGSDLAKHFFGCQNHFWQLARWNSWHSYWVQYFWQRKASLAEFCQK